MDHFYRPTENDSALHELRQLATTALVAMEQCGAPVREAIGYSGIATAEKIQPLISRARP